MSIPFKDLFRKAFNFLRPIVVEEVEKEVARQIEKRQGDIKRRTGPTPPPAA